MDCKAFSLSFLSRVSVSSSSALSECLWEKKNKEKVRSQLSKFENWQLLESVINYFLSRLGKLNENRTEERMNISLKHASGFPILISLVMVYCILPGAHHQLKRVYGELRLVVTKSSNYRIQLVFTKNFLPLIFARTPTHSRSHAPTRARTHQPTHTLQ